MKRQAAVLACLAAAAATAAAGDADYWRGKVIYQLLTDRFALPPGSPAAPCSNLNTYCGGTFSGVQHHLDYITGMGFDAAWISPIPPNTPDGYHGYWQRCVVTSPSVAGNCSVVNPHFGSEGELSAMTAAGAAQGVAFMLDVVGNHMGGTIGDMGTFVPFDTPASFHNCAGCPSDCGIQDYGNPAQVLHCRLAGLPDLNQTTPFVAGTLQAWVKTVVTRFGFQGLRVDTVPEVPKPFWQQYAGAAGVFAVGEVFNGDVGYVSSFQGAALPSLLSYPMFFTLRSVFGQQASMYGLQSMVKSYAAFPDDSVLGTFVDNHDNPRFLSQQPDWTLYSNALLWVLTARGIPIWYYGTEYGFDGAVDPANREALWPAGYDVQGHPLGVFGRTVNKLRSVRGLTAGADQTQRYADDSFYAFTRGASPTDPTAMFIALTNTGSKGGDVTRTITYHPYPDGTQLCNWFASSPGAGWAGLPPTLPSPRSSHTAAPTTLFAALRAAGAAAGQVSLPPGPHRTTARLQAAAAATAQVLREVGAGGGEDCVTVEGGAFSVTLGLGEPKVYLPQ